MTKSEIPKIFVSYSWKPFSNKEKVIELAKRLTSDGVHVIIDEWDLKGGQDKYSFMEQMVNDTAVKNVLLICNKDYHDKANQKMGGVGIESLIVSDEIYKQADQIKFLPIIFEYSETGAPYTPAFVKTRIYFDLSNNEVFEENYEALLRHIHNRPLSSRPPIGTMPAYLRNDEPVYLPTANKVNGLKKALIEEKKNAVIYLQDYYDSWIEGLNHHIHDVNDLFVAGENYDDVIVSWIDKLRPLRDDFCNFLDIYLSYSVDIDLERIHEFFGRCLNFLINLDGFDSDSGRFGSLKNDHFRFFFYELFLYVAAIMVKKNRFEEFSFLLNTKFLVNRKGHFIEYSFIYFKYHSVSLNEYRNKKLNLQRASVTADLIKERTKGDLFQELKEVDALLYYISILQNVGRYWLPETAQYDVYSLLIMERAVSTKFFNKIKCLFGVSSKDELITKTLNAKSEGRDRLERFYFEVPDIAEGLNLKKLCTFS